MADQKIRFIIEANVGRKLSDAEKSDMTNQLRNTTHTTLSQHGLPPSAVTVTNGAEKK